MTTTTISDYGDFGELSKKLKNKLTTLPLPNIINPSINSLEGDSEDNSFFTDIRDGQVYTTTKIGNQIWMTENFNYKTEGSYHRENDSKDGEKYSRFFIWKAAMEACPKGWHLPTDEEWKILINHYGGYYDRGDQTGKTQNSYQALIKEGHSHFDILLAGKLSSKKHYVHKNKYGYYWSATKKDNQNSNYVLFNGYYKEICKSQLINTEALSVRYVKDRIQDSHNFPRNENSNI